MSRRKETLSSRERVRLALEHRETDRIPIAMVCSGINSPAREAVDAYLRRERGIALQPWLDSFIDIRQVGPAYVGPPLKPMEDIWGVRRVVMHNPAGGHYDEIEHYPLAEAEDPGDLESHRWPSTEWFDYSVLPARIAAAQADGERCLMVTNGNLFETSWYMRGFQQMFVDMVLNPELFHAIMGRVTDFYVAHFRAMLAAANGAGRPGLYRRRHCRAERPVDVARHVGDLPQALPRAPQRRDPRVRGKGDLSHRWRGDRGGRRG